MFLSNKLALNLKFLFLAGYLFCQHNPRQVVEIRLVFLLLIHFKTAVAELHQIFDLVVAELVPQHEIFDFVEAELVLQLDKR